MPRRTFEDPLSDFPRAHLIVGYVESLKATATAEKVIGSLIERLRPRPTGRQRFDQHVPVAKATHALTSTLSSYGCCGVSMLAQLPVASSAWAGLL
jgi:hypothetical protein